MSPARLIPTIAALVAIASTCGAQPALRRLCVGPEIGVYLPVSGETRDRFGSSWLSIGAGFGNIEQTTSRWRASADYALIHAESGDDHVWLAPVGITCRRGLAGGPSARLYTGAGASLYFTEMRSDPDGIRGRIRTAAGGCAFAGVSFGRHGFVEARYMGASAIRGIDLSGFQLAAGYRF